jgi:ubiquinone/menaquinone biosynthesis C-methylase UbiE
MLTETSMTSADYWEHRAKAFAVDRDGLAAVCSYAMPLFYNRYIQYCQRRALRRWLGRTLEGTSTALDVGCGVGRWSLELAARGHEVLGMDFSPSMVEQARTRAARAGLECSFVVGDITTMQLGRTFDLIVCVTVLQHILRPEHARETVKGLAAHLRSGGRLVLLEAAPTRASSRCDHAAFRTRSLAWYVEALQASGLTVIAHCGVDPMPFKTWLLPYYRRMPRILATAALALVTAASFPLDLLLARGWPDQSWHKVLVAERARSGS